MRKVPSPPNHFKHAIWALSFHQNALRYTLSIGGVSKDHIHGIDGFKSIIDDMLVWGSSKEEHNRNMKRVPERTREVGIKWNAEKFVIGSELLWSCIV